MKIRFLGTSHGRPEPNRKCSSILLETSKKRYLIDIGNDVSEYFATENIPIQSIDAIFITHMHSDHTNGLLPFVFLLNGAFKDANPCIFLPSEKESVVPVINGWLKCNNVAIIRNLNYQQITSGEIYNDGVIRVIAYKTQHIINSYAFLVESDGKRILFSGDLSSKGPVFDLPEDLLNSPLDLAVCESAHFNPTEYEIAFKNNKNLKRLCINHYTNRFLPYAEKLKDTFSDVEVSIAYDGKLIEV